MATLQSDHALLTRAVHAGLNVVKAKYTFTGSPSAGDVIQICRLPTQATVTSLVFYGDLTSTSALTVKVGTDSSVARFYASSSIITTLHTCTLVGTSEVTRGIGYTFSASNDSATSYEYVSATVVNAGSVSPGDSFSAIISYVLSN